MPPPDPPTLFMLLVMAGGVCVFLRLVAKEKHRREKWLQYRLDKKIKELQEKQAAQAANEAV